MTAITLALAAIALVPAPQKMSVTDGAFTTNLTVTCARDEKIPAEGYRLKVEADGVKVWSSDDAGRFYAGETLKQLTEKGKCPLVEIEDAPRYKWRGVHFDDCRHFFGKETLKKTINVMSQYKFNVLHWHLTDDQGWRLDVPGYPDLVKYGAVRRASPKHGARMMRNPDGTSSMALDGQAYGPFFYTEADIREVVAYAAERHVRIVPEIELPGHVFAALAAYPEFACNPENLAARSPRLIWGVEQDVLCVGNDRAIRFMEDVLDYVCRVFPSEVIHIGGDECPRKRWESCPKCQKRIRDERLGDTKNLQAWATRHFVEFLFARGKRTIGWDEYLLGEGIPATAMGMSWRLGETASTGHGWLSPAELAAKGHDVVMTPMSACYLDYRQELEDDPFEYIGGVVTLAQCHAADFCAGVPQELRKHILGGQGNNWSEYTWNQYDLEWKMWPRACALAEALWCGERKPAFADFVRRMKVHRKRLTAQGVNCAPVE